MSKDPEPGFYWVRNFDSGDWVIAELSTDPGRYPWTLLGTDEIYEASEFAEIGERIPNHE
jgi:hypothetical protein